MQKILKNLTSPPTNIEISETGVTLLPTENYIIDPANYLYWAKPETITELTPYVNTGDVIVNNGTYDLSATDGLRFLEYADRMTIKNGGTVSADVTKTINFLSPLSVLNTGDGEVDVSIAGAGSVQGRTFAVELGNNGNTANKWLFYTSTSDATDILPYHAAFDLEIYGVTFTNKNTFTDCDIEFYVNGTNNPAKVHTVQVRDYLHYYETTVTNFFTLAVGDDLSVFVRKVGQSTPSSVIVQLQMKITTNAVGSGGDND